MKYNNQLVHALNVGSLLTCLYLVWLIPFRQKYTFYLNIGVFQVIMEIFFAIIVFLIGAYIGYEISNMIEKLKPKKERTMRNMK